MAATPTAALSRGYTFATHAPLFRVSGGIPTADLVNLGQWLFPITKIGNGTAANGNLAARTGDVEDFQSCWTVTIATDADALECRQHLPQARLHRPVAPAADARDRS